MAESSKGEYGPVLTCSRGEYEKILQAHGVNTRKYWLVEVIENGCIVTRVRVYNEILPEPSSRHNTVTLSHSSQVNFMCSEKLSSMRGSEDTDKVGDCS